MAVIAAPQARAASAPKLAIQNISQIVCEATTSYEEDAPGQKTPVQALLIFTAGSRTDVKPAPGAFVLNQYALDQNNQLHAFDGNNQYYFSLAGDKLTFGFIAPWKAQGELTVKADGTAQGTINSKTHMNDLTCVLVTK